MTTKKSKEPNAICQQCGKAFHVKPSALKHTKYCCRICCDTARTQKIGLTCANCGAKISKSPSRTKWKIHFCSMECYSEYKAKSEKGGWTLESREKASASHAAITNQTNADNYKRHLGKRIHREVAEKMLGRPLLPEEVVHHINGDKHDNRPENLMVFPNQKAHVDYHAKHPKESGVILGKR